MTMTQPQRVILYRLLGELRPDWHDAGTNDACVELAKRDGSPFELVSQAVRQAGIASNRTPTCIVWPVTDTTPKPTLGRTVPEYVNPCTEHPESGVRMDGTCAGCWVDKAENPEPYRRPVAPISDEQRAERRALVAAALHRENT